jgi:uncharacterized protein (TIGR02001 family)
LNPFEISLLCLTFEQGASFVTLITEGNSGDFGHRTFGSTAAAQAKFERGPPGGRGQNTGFSMRGNMLKTTIIAAGALALMAGTSLAADAPVVTKAPPMVGKAPVGGGFAVEYGGWVASDYVFRGTTQSAGGPSAGASFTAVWGNTFYLGVAGAAVDWPIANGLSDPSAEIDFVGGLRLSSGKWSFDVGAIYYYYPKEIPFQSDFWEVYGIAKYAVTDQLTVGASINHSPNYLKYSMEGTTGALMFAWTAPTSYKDLAFFVSGDIGRVWLGETSPGGVFVPDYTYWSLGLGWTWKNITLDLRYHDTDLSGAGCLGIWNTGGAGNSTSGWCGEAYDAKLSFAGSTAN